MKRRTHVGSELLASFFDVLNMVNGLPATQGLLSCFQNARSQLGLPTCLQSWSNKDVNIILDLSHDKLHLAGVRTIPPASIFVQYILVQSVASR